MVNKSPVICAGAIVEVVLARKTDEHALIVGERAGSRSGVPAEDRDAGVRDRR